MQELLQGGVQKLEQHPETKCVLCADAGVAARWSAEA